ncbi:MAG: LysR family transcriptional regulator [Alphaproteobacteria bacterium]|jgi:DNA-binding transcriptional LysR family regulator
MDRLREYEVFVAVAETGGFAAAGRTLGLSAPSVTRLVSGLEERLGTRLFTRTTRSLALSESGAGLLEGARGLIAEANELEQQAMGSLIEARGHLTVSASVTFGRSVMAPVLRGFLDAYPLVTLHAVLLDRVVNLVEEGIDVAVRIGELPDSSHVARRVGTVRRMLVASPRYLERQSIPNRPSELTEHDIITFTGLMPHREWRYVEDGKARRITLAPRLEINDAVAAIDAARHDQGITIALSYMIADALADGSLMPVLEPFAPPPAPVHLVHAHGRLVAPKVRAFLDHAAPRLQQSLSTLSDA